VKGSLKQSRERKRGEAPDWPSLKTTGRRAQKPAVKEKGSRTMLNRSNLIPGCYDSGRPACRTNGYPGKKETRKFTRWKSKKKLVKGPSLGGDRQGFYQKTRRGASRLRPRRRRGHERGGAPMMLTPQGAADITCQDSKANLERKKKIKRTADRALPWRWREEQTFGL